MSSKKCGQNCSCNNSFGAVNSAFYVQAGKIYLTQVDACGKIDTLCAPLPDAEVGAGDYFGGNPNVTQNGGTGNITVSDGASNSFTITASQICAAVTASCPSSGGGDGFGTSPTVTQLFNGNIALTNGEGQTLTITAAQICAAVAASCPGGGGDGDGFGTNLNVQQQANGNIHITNGEGQTIIITAADICDAVLQTCPTSLTDNLNGTYTFRGTDQINKTISTCCNTTGSFAAGQLTINQSNGPPVSVSIPNNFGSNPVVTQVGSGNITVTDGGGNNFTITAAHICAAVAVACPGGSGGGDGFGTSPTVGQLPNGNITLSNNEGQTMTITALQICEAVNQSCPATIVDNGSGQFTIEGNDGNSEIIQTCCNSSMALSVGNILTLNQSGGAPVQVDLSVLAINNFGANPLVTQDGITKNLTIADGGGHSFTITSTQICEMVAQACPGGGGTGDGFGTSPAVSQNGTTGDISLTNGEGQTMVITAAQICAATAIACPGGGNTSIFTDNTAGNGLNNGTIVHQDGMGTSVTVNVCAAMRACIDPVQTAVSGNFADPLNPTLIEAQALATALPNGGPTVIAYTDTSGDLWRWFVSDDKTAVLIERPFDTVFAPPVVVDNLSSAGNFTYTPDGGSTQTLNVCDALSFCISARSTIPSLSLTTPSNPAEAAAYAITNSISGPTVLLYTHGDGNYRYFIDVAGNAVVIESPAGADCCDTEAMASGGTGTWAALKPGSSNHLMVTNAADELIGFVDENNIPHPLATPCRHFVAELGKIGRVTTDASPTNCTPLSILHDVQILAMKAYVTTASTQNIIIEVTRSDTSAVIGTLTILANQKSSATQALATTVQAGVALEDRVTSALGDAIDLNVVIEGEYCQVLGT